VRRAWLPLGLGLAVALILWWTVLDPAAAFAVGLTAAGAGLALQRIDAVGEPWRWLPPQTPRRGERRDAQELAWALAGRDGRVSKRALGRVRAVAAHRLARHGLDLDAADDEPALVALVGARTLETLRHDREPYPRLADVERAIAVLDRLGPGQPARVPVPSRSNPR
jgi:hypothetical protein